MAIRNVASTPVSAAQAVLGANPVPPPSANAPRVASAWDRINLFGRPASSARPLPGRVSVEKSLLTSVLDALSSIFTYIFGTSSSKAAPKRPPLPYSPKIEIVKRRVDGPVLPAPTTLESAYEDVMSRYTSSPTMRAATNKKMNMHKARYLAKSRKANAAAVQYAQRTVKEAMDAETEEFNKFDQFQQAEDNGRHPILPAPKELPAPKPTFVPNDGFSPYRSDLLADVFHADYFNQ